MSDKTFTEQIISHVPPEIAADDRLMRESVIIAIEKAERFGTGLIIKENGVITEISPAEMRRRLAK